MESRSTFVSVLAWIFIIGAGFGSVIGIMQIIMVSTMFSGDELSSMPADAPAFAKIMQQYFHLFVYGFFAITLFTFISSIALLKRKNWARLAFVVILAFGVIWQIGSLFLQFYIFSDFPEMPNQEHFEEFERMHNMMRWFTAVIAIGISGLFIWIIKKLTSQPIINEFIHDNNNL
jgi:hypothetical protein